MFAKFYLLKCFLSNQTIIEINKHSKLIEEKKYYAMLYILEILFENKYFLFSK
jgi:hypothetical protein